MIHLINCAFSTFMLNLVFFFLLVISEIINHYISFSVMVKGRYGSEEEIAFYKDNRLV